MASNQKQTPAILPSAGGRLMSAYSEDTVGLANYCRKVNFRLIGGEVEARREGWVKFRPNTDIPQGLQAVPPPQIQLISGDSSNFTSGLGAWTEYILGEISNPAGTMLITGSGIAGAKISGLLTVGKRYRATVRASSPTVTSLNIGAVTATAITSTPADYTVEFTATLTYFAIYWTDTDLEERTVTIDNVTLAEVEPITLLAENVRPNSDRCVIAATQTTIFRFTYSTGTWSVIGSGYSAAGNRWQTETINGWIIFNNGVDLPCSYRVEDSAVVPLKELREVGIASVKCITQLNGFLLCMNVREIKAVSLNAVMNGVAPYGLVDDSLVNHIPYRVIWPEPAQPTNWAPSFKVTQGASSATITLPFASSVFVAGVTRVAVLNGGPDGDTLGGDSAHPDGILVTAVAGNVITLEIPTTAGLSYPREISVTRWSDISAFSAYKDLQGDASHITVAKQMHKKLSVIYRTRGIYLARFTGNVAEPFTFVEMETTNVPTFPDAVASVAGDYHIYPGNGGFFYMFDGVNAPELFPPLNDCSNLIIGGLTPSSTLFAVENQLTKESWFCRSDRTICFDHESKTVSEIDAGIGAAAFVSRPGWDTDWFILARGGTIYTYGFIDNAPTTWLRDGVNPGGYLRWGRANFGDAFNEKRLRTYLMMFATGQAAVPMRLIIRSSYGASEAMVEELNEVFPNPAIDGGMVPVDYQAVYFQDELSIATATAIDADVRFVGRVMERATMRSMGTTRNNA